MSYEQFWKNGIDLFIIYINAYNRRQKDEYTKLDTLAWNVGIYVMRALQSQPTMTYGMTDAKAMKKCHRDYPNKPMTIEQAEEEKRKNELFKEKKKAERPTQEQLEAYNKLIADAKKRKEE